MGASHLEEVKEECDVSLEESVESELIKATLLESSFPEKDMGSPKGHQAVHKQTPWPWGKDGIWAALGKTLQAAQRNNPSSLLSTGEATRLEFCDHSWTPQFKRHVDLLEKFQHRAAKLTDQNISSTEELRAGTVYPGEEKAQRDLTKLPREVVVAS
ncbi:hypothetical protein WISP_38495 [Willisornis vidua]|uniref:Uncharacterized protein n=1 Tax=Willisornis vidua TaxID=1566151 RepID=A0ABQ9DIE9_9PASS|nr:hypothetical protein WISP_38495 [Willisornis vidua]